MVWVFGFHKILCKETGMGGRVQSNVREAQGHGVSSVIRVLGDGVDCCCAAETAFAPLNISIFP